MKPWGILASIDLKNCDPDMIRSRVAIATYIKELVKLIDMKPYGETEIIHFGSSKEVTGYTVIQLIETSLISGHFVNETNEAFIDIFSCKAYNVGESSSFTCNYFKADEAKVTIVERGNWD